MPAQRARTIPRGAEAIPRFAPSAQSLGEAYAQQILEGFRKELEGIEVKARAAGEKRSARRKKA
jgi:hypothetical protein